MNESNVQQSYSAIYMSPFSVYFIGFKILADVTVTHVVKYGSDGSEYTMCATCNTINSSCSPVSHLNIKMLATRVTANGDKMPR